MKSQTSFKQLILPNRSDLSETTNAPVDANKQTSVILHRIAYFKVVLVAGLLATEYIHGG